MTIEERAKAYDEALERAREIKRTYPQDKVCETIFSELKESEDKDEEIKKALITLIQSCDKGCYITISPSRIKEYTAWLEKQGKQKPTEWSKEDERLLNNMVIVIQDYYNKEDAQSLISWLKSLKDRAQPQNCIYYNPYKEVVESIAEMCKHYDKASHGGLRDFYDNVNVKCKDAKEYDSLFPQNTWKPSDEQLEALKNAIHIKPLENPSDNPLWTLYEQLKKLLEE